MRDHHTSTERDAGISAQHDAHPDWQDERAEPSDIAPSHQCDLVPFPDDCLGCQMWERYWIREREERPPVELPEVLPMWMQKDGA